MDSEKDHEAPQPLTYTFSKEERLCSKRLITLLFSKGSSFNLYPLRFVFYTEPGTTPAPTQVVISVSKRHFKRAVDRNRLKRQMREAYRLNKQLLLADPAKAPALLGILYIGKEKNPFNLFRKN
ncbi:ribonuclease P protein component [Pontibacter pudoricolor]|uniref:ribonuclease P protein component n=1 Tax=Pontibacter pudoricolor TaxID=2694930 RepID=UPI001391F9D0|nr:ribonuclease P protein component [Pontibacter pudoricolor]